MADPRITTARAVELLAGATPGAWFQTIDGDLCAGTPDDCEYVTDPEYGCIVAAADFHLFSAAPDLAADLIDARATIDALTAELKAARELRGIVVAREHARAVRAIFWRLYNDDLGCEGFWRVSATRSDLIATLTRCGLTDAEAVKVADGDS